MKVAGVQVNGGSVYLVVAECATPGTPVRFVASARLVPSDGLGEAEQLADLQARLTAELRPHGLDDIAMLHTRQFARWTYAHALARITSICAVMGTATALHVRFGTHTTNQVAGTVKLDASKLQTLHPGALGLPSKPTYWTAGLAEAAAVAVHCASPEIVDA